MQGLRWLDSFHYSNDRDLHPTKAYLKKILRIIIVLAPISC